MNTTQTTRFHSFTPDQALIDSSLHAYHVVASIHDSRTSMRMVKYKARERRFGGVKPYPEVFPMRLEEERLIAQTIQGLAKEMDLRIGAFNVCSDHMHLLLICEREEVSKIMHRIKGRTARVCNAYRYGHSLSKRGEREGVCGDACAHTYANKGINPLGAQHAHAHQHPRPLPQPALKDGSVPFWTQKFGCKPIKTAKHYWNTINYIQSNRAHHGLPNDAELQNIIDAFVRPFDVECLPFLRAQKRVVVN